MSDHNEARTFKLVIRFRCLCFFAPDERTGQMHVLMPDTGAHAHHGHGAHGAGGADGQGNGNGHGVDKHVVRLHYPPFGDDDFLKLEGWRLEFGKGLGPADLRLPFEVIAGPNASQVRVEVADLGRVTGKGIARALVGPNPGPSVVSHVVLHAGSAIDLTPDTVWELDGKELAMASELVWTIPGIPGDRLVLEPERLDEAREPEPNHGIPELVPTDGVVELRVFHVTEQDFPPPLKGLWPATAAQHFSIYYELYPGLDERKKKLPRHKGNLGGPETLSVGCTGATGRLG